MALSQVEGPLFFASARKFKALFTKEEDPDDVELHCMGMQIMDFSALDAIAKVASEYKALGKRFHLRFLRQVRKLASFARKRRERGSARCQELSRVASSCVDERRAPGGSHGSRAFQNTVPKRSSRSLGPHIAS